MAKDDLTEEAGKGLQTEMEGMPPKAIKVAFHGMSATLEGEDAEKLMKLMDDENVLGTDFKISASGYVKHAGKTWLEGEEGKRPEITIQVRNVKLSF